MNVGHGRDEIVEAAMAQMRSSASYQTFGVFANRPALDLAERLADLAPLDDPRIFLGSGGGDAIDTAAKLARRYFAAIGTPERTHLISRSQGYHGTHGLGTSIGGIPANRQDVGPLDPDASVVPYDSLEALEAEIERVGADRVAAVFVEPVIGAGGVRQPAPGYIEGVAELCARTGVLFVCDSVIAGFGRLGTWFGIERWDVRPDMLTFAKGVTSGYLPLGGVVVGAKVAAPFWEDGAWFRHGPTYSGHPTVCAAAMANLDIIGSALLPARKRPGRARRTRPSPPCGRTGVSAPHILAWGLGRRNSERRATRPATVEPSCGWQSSGTSIRPPRFATTAFVRALRPGGRPPRAATATGPRTGGLAGRDHPEPHDMIQRRDGPRDRHAPPGLVERGRPPHRVAEEGRRPHPDR